MRAHVTEYPLEEEGAREFLCFCDQPHSLVSQAAVKGARDLVRERHRQEKRAEQARR